MTEAIRLPCGGRGPPHAKPKGNIMCNGGGAFSPEEVEYLRSLPVVAEATSRRITYTESFKHNCMRRYHAGESPVELFREAGLDPSLIGYKRIERCFARWRKIACRMGTDRLVSVDGNGGVVPSASADVAPSAESAEVARSEVSQPVQPTQTRKRKAMRRCPCRATQPKSRFCREVTCATCSSPSRCAASTSWNARWRRCGRNCIANNRKNRKNASNRHRPQSDACRERRAWRAGRLAGMRIARFTHNDVPQYAFVQTDKNDGKDYLVALNGYPLSGQAVEPTGERYPVDGDGIRLLAPVIPSKVYGLAKNYEAHAQFMHEAGHSDIKHAPEDMVIFTKPSTSVIGPDDPIVIPLCSNDMNFEPELAVVMGRIAKNVPVEQAMDYVLGFTCVNDVTLRDLQGLDPTWTRAKGFDTACPLGPWIVTRDDVDWKDAKISFTLNGEDVPMASGTTANLIHGIPEQIAAITSFTTLLPGDVIMTGTPNASGHLDPGDEAIVHVEGIGDLRNVVVRG